MRNTMEHVVGSAKHQERDSERSSNITICAKDFGDLFVRRLQQSRQLVGISDVIITINTRSVAEAEVTAEDLTVARLVFLDFAFCDF